MARSTWTLETMETYSDIEKYKEIELNSENYRAIDPDAWKYEKIYLNFENLDLDFFCFLIFINHASFRDKIFSRNILSSFRDSRGASSPEPPARASPVDPTGAALRTPAPPSTCTPFPVPPTTRMPAIIKVTQAANFHVLIG